MFTNNLATFILLPSTCLPSDAVLRGHFLGNVRVLEAAAYVNESRRTDVISVNVSYTFGTQPHLSSSFVLSLQYESE